MSDATRPQQPPDDEDGLRPGDPDRLGRFVVRRRLPAGGMGVAYLAANDTGTPVVVKTLRPDHAAVPAYRNRFRREILAASSVRSSFTAPVLASDLDADRQWVAIAFVPGPTLDALVVDVGPLRGPHLTALALALAEGLGQLHALRLVHRDLKPANIICADDGPKLIDFGIAEFEHDDLLTVAELGQLGSPGWIAPERLAGNPRPAAAEDIYAWGCVCWYAATGQHPPTNLPLSPGDIDLNRLPGDLADLVVAALAADPTQRPAATSIVDRLRHLDPTIPTAAQVTRAWTDDESPTEQFRTRSHTRPPDRGPAVTGTRGSRMPLPRWAAVGLLVSAALLAVGGTAAVLDQRRSAPSNSTATPATISAPTSRSAPTADPSSEPPTPTTSSRTRRPRPTPTVTVTAQVPAPSPPATTANSCLEYDVGLIPEPRRALSIADRGRFSEQVLAVQDALNTLGYGCLDEDGRFGPATRDAVRTFQRDHGLFIDGIITPKLYRQLITFAAAGRDGCIEPFC